MSKKISLPAVRLDSGSDVNPDKWSGPRVTLSLIVEHIFALFVVNPAADGTATASLKTKMDLNMHFSDPLLTSVSVNYNGLARTGVFLTSDTDNFRMLMLIPEGEATLPLISKQKGTRALGVHTLIWDDHCSCFSATRVQDMEREMGAAQLNIFPENLRDFQNVKIFVNILKKRK